MRFRTEAVGGYDLGGLIFAVLAIIGLGVLGLVMLIVGGLRHGAGRSGKGLLIGGLVLMIPALWVFSQVY